MAKAKAKRKKQIKKQSPFKNYWNKQNYILLGVGVGIIILGFIFMAQGPWDSTASLSLSPIILLIAYIIVFPLSILYKNKKNPPTKDVSSES
ncbi:MAG: hypothetical protein R3250_09600 [Melioribacteraceae bacterium]|nr:hypothetical protein [Melioribacteraceae bacterium]